jgi:hypothetical protein
MIQNLQKHLISGRKIDLILT